MYRDGVVIGTNSLDAAFINNSVDLWFGARVLNDRFFTGLIDEVGFWNRDLTPSEVASIIFS